MLWEDKERIGKAIYVFEPENNQKDVYGTGTSVKIKEIIGRYFND